VLAQPHEALVCLGDLVGYGPAPGPVVRRIRAEATLVLQGNHDRALADGVAPGCRVAFEHLARATAPLGAIQLSPDEIAYLGSLPRSATRAFDGVNCLFVHATPGDPLYRYLLADPQEWQREVAGLDVDLVAVGHTHCQFELDLARCRVVNPGSVGQPKDGDPRAAYAILEHGRLTPGRVEYPVDLTVGALEAAKLPEDVVRFLADLLRSGSVPLKLDPHGSAH
jgi:diadenosine tetraphosphatase ApaH/serine/threonine PP2A family protein phosphatase